MSILGIVKKLPDYAEDIKRNLLDIFEEQKTDLEKKELFGISLAVCYSLGHEQLLNGVRAEAKLYLEDIDATACKIAATIMAMTNVYYSFTGNIEEYQSLESKLSILSLKNPEVPKKEIEMYCLAISILNSCKHCTLVHTKKLIDHGVSQESIRDIARVTGILKAAMTALEIERMRSYDFVVRDASMN